MTSNDIIKEAFSFENEEEKIQFEAEMIHLDLIEEISKLMEAKGMKRADLAKALGTTKGYVTQLFSGDRFLNIKTLAKIKNIFDVKIKIEFQEKKKHKKKDCEEHKTKTVKSVRSRKNYQKPILERRALLK
jgi:transcriptional regulator with XRE-family HTH domain